MRIENTAGFAAAIWGEFHDDDGIVAARSPVGLFLCRRVADLQCDDILCAVAARLIRKTYALIRLTQFAVDKVREREWNYLGGGTVEAPMQDYEIRILSHGRTHTLIEILHLNDQTAIRAAREIAGGRPFEVWRDLECIHGGAKPAAPLHRYKPAH